MAHAIITSFMNLIDSNGIPISSARVFVLDAGSTNLKTIYSDTSLATPATNPVVVTSGGPHDIRYVAAGSYKIQVETGGSATLGSGTVLTRYSKDNIDTGVAVGSGALPVASGGTAATTAASARTSLGAASSSDLSAVAVDVAELQDTLTGTDATQIALGTTAQRPISPADGQIRRNSTIPQFEGYDTGWRKFLIETDIAAQSDMEAATSTALLVSPGRLKFHPGVAKAWAYVTVSGGTPTIQASHNIASVGSFSGAATAITFTTAMSSAVYAVNATAAGTGIRIARMTSISTTGFSLTFNTDAGAGSDPDAFCFSVFGDFA